MTDRNEPYIDGEHFVYPDGRRLPRAQGGENVGGPPAAFAPEQAPLAQDTANQGAQQQGPQGEPAQQQQAPAGADPRVLEQMQQQMQQFGQVIGPMAEALPALQQFAQTQQQQQQGPPEPSLEDMAAMFFGGQQQGPGMPPQPMVPDPYGQGVQYDAYGNPVGYDPYGGAAPQMQQQMQQQGIPPQLAPQFQQFQQQQAQQGQPADPSQFVDFLRRVVREEVSPLQQGLTESQQQRQQEAWDRLYTEIPAMKDPQQAPQIAQRVAQAAYMFGRSDEEAQRLARDPGFARMVHLSSQTEAQAQGETPAGAGDGVTAVESGSGASALGQGEIDPGDAIVGAGRTAGAQATVFAGGR